ncbi:MAG: glycerol-3-phosphate acyltransferase [Cyanomargarita calcarea GSE-NOS-MK-12-04C]|jgi:pyruvate,water dikinase|uniref:Glycerol-3-phosphate acyltransferase n=1 Tax=Cyanomargarita calcarea GSE-NOS-MK-12-04C TaxID=2839659 RepID=A0A951QM30_9CYAN|nr:glycerol-3-phosphate acyltransferase [Cyanomargarita calcarea GSE-NOS-MK-12-04C]
MVELWGALVILIICPLLGGLPLIALITQALKGRQLAHMGTGNVGVSAAFYHGGTVVGILAVLSEAGKGIAAVLLARAFFPSSSAWELVALIALVVGRYWVGKGAGTTNVVWGFVIHDPLAAGFVSLLAAISFTIVRDRQLAKFGVLILFPLIIGLLHVNDSPRIMVAIALAALLGWIYKQIPDDLDLPTSEAQADSQGAFQLLRGDRQGILSLDEDLDSVMVGNKAARLSEIKQWGYPVPKGWIIPPAYDPEPLLDFFQPSELSPLVVRSSAIGEDSEHASAAGQYETVLNVTNRQELQQAIAKVQASYDSASAMQYRRDFADPSGSERSINQAAMAVLIQQQVQSVFSGVAFSRDPMTQEADAVVIEALPGGAENVVSGRVTPEQYRAFVFEAEHFSSIQLEGEGRVPAVLIKQVAYLARHLEERYHGVPQDIEWSYDGQTLWVLQARPITTLLPIWTRKIAAEVIPGFIRPLTWSINRPLTCGVWGELFTVVLGKRAAGLDFNETATLHHSRAYFNASLLGQIFLRMGLPPESLEFLTRGAKMSKPPLESTMRNLPGLLKLMRKEFSLAHDFERDYRRRFAPGLSQLSQEFVDDLEPSLLLVRIEFILTLLHRATYYSIMAPLSAALRQGVFRVNDGNIDHSMAPEVAALRSLDEIAANAKELLPEFDPETLFEDLAISIQGQKVLTQFEMFFKRYGYLSDVGTDIAVPTWREEPEAVKQLFVQLMQAEEPSKRKQRQGKKRGFVQGRVNLKGRVTEVYSRLLAELRWTFLALEQKWLQSGLLVQTGDIFFLELQEVRQLIEGSDSNLIAQLRYLVQIRRSQFAASNQLLQLPVLVYGNTPPIPIQNSPLPTHDSSTLHGIPASPGVVMGKVKVLRNLQAVPDINRETILVVPYTDSGWAPMLMRAGGIIAEAGGRLSHGAIVAREYGIPAVMDVKSATWLLQDGQWVKIDGSRGIVEVSNDLRPY